MKTFKKIIRFLRLMFLLTIAAIGIGLAGGVPLQITHKREVEEQAVEWVMSDEEQSEHESEPITIGQKNDNTTI